MLFANDTEEGLRGAAALVNTDDDDGELLPDVGALQDFAREWNWTGNLALDEAELHAVRALRPRLRALWQGDEDFVVESVNGLLREFNALPQLVRHDHWDYHIHATPLEAPLSARMAVEAAMAFVDLVRSNELGRLRICAAEDCSAVVIDLSKNRSRRFCESGCGNRAAVAAYRARQRASV
ncbi:putative RNA-binding Zn ribbon-like protein [Arthrobacter pigmenti]|uniref:Putative RNA-binding Zn ribbon-like protein n=1 Tax=Arthrobacter pigmenti TaxID=271432 RepID=A0A846RPT3_9MICC|nr:CGNR zinc finger domain-containing protein [Arthrobacter pigmenti]NJC21116.1 putative RNA-binding Zn ribbon-like protein [Arthrobacter pigmenti]